MQTLTPSEYNFFTNYAMSLGQNGVGFYLWDGKPIGANKAYMTLDKLNACRDFLKQNGIFDQDSFIDFFEED